MDRKESTLNGKLAELIGIEKTEPSLANLSRVVECFMCRVPFENISKIFYYRRNRKKQIPDFSTYLNGIERYHFGGTCYTNNCYLNGLLRYFGYDADLCGADMENPDVHLVNIVKIEEREFLVDSGYAAPFLKPLPRDLDEKYIVEFGPDRYVLNPQDSQGNSRVDLYRKGELAHGYTAKPIPRKIEYFKPAIEHSYSDEGVFLNSILMVRFYNNRSVAIRNLSVIESNGTDYNITKLKSKDELPETISNYFGIPEHISAEAIDSIDELQE